MNFDFLWRKFKDGERWPRASAPSPEVLAEDIDRLVALGFITAVGINENGQWLYAATDLGRSLVKDITGIDLPKFKDDEDKDDE